MWTKALVFVAVLIGVLAMSASASAAPISFGFTGTGVALNGSAGYSGTSLILTNGSQQRGSAWAQARLDVGPALSFSTEFDFRAINASFLGSGNGFAFVIQGSLPGTSALGSTANSTSAFTAGYGYQGITQSVAVVFETFAGNEIGILSNGSSVALAQTSTALAYDDGSAYKAWIDYDSVSDLLEVRVGNGARPTSALLSTFIDIPSLLGGSPTYAGFTASTGSVSYSRFLIDSWQLNLVPVASVPELGTAAYLLAALGCLAAWNARRRLRHLALRCRV